MEQQRLQQISRYERREVLENSMRARLFGQLEARPGATALELANATGCSYPSTRYHLDRLERAMVVVRQSGTRPFRYFTAGGMTSDHRLGIAVLRSKTAARVMSLIEQTPGMSKADLGRATGLGGPTIAWHLNRLEAAGLVRVGKAGRRTPITPVTDRLATITAVIRAMDEPTTRAPAALPLDPLGA